MNTEIKKVFNSIVFSEYLYICDEELERRSIYVCEVTDKQEKLAEDFRLMHENNIKKHLEKEDIKLCDEFYEALTENGTSFLNEINEEIVKLTKAQSEIKASVNVNLDLDVSLDTSTREDMVKILEIVSKEGSIGTKEEILSKMANTIYKNKKLNLEEINKQIKEIFK